MLTHTSIYPIDISAGSASIPAGAQNYSYLITGTKNFSGSAVAITMSGTVPTNSVRMFYVDITPSNYDTSTGDHLTILGTVIPNAILQPDGKFIAIAVYSSSSWKVFMYPSWDSIDFITNAQLADDAVDTENIAANAVESAQVAAGAINSTNLADESVTNAKLAHVSTQTFKGRTTAGTGDVEDLTLSQSRTLMNHRLAMTGPEVEATTTLNASTGELECTDSRVLDGVIGHHHLDAEAALEILVVAVSFEATEVGKQFIEIPYPCTLVKAVATVSRTLAGTDDGTISLLNNAAASMSSGVITVPASSTVGTATGGLTVSPSSNNTFIAGDDLQIVTSKATAGGRCNLVLHLQRT